MSKSHERACIREGVLRLGFLLGISVKTVDFEAVSCLWPLFFFPVVCQQFQDIHFLLNPNGIQLQTPMEF